MNFRKFFRPSTDCVGVKYIIIYQIYSPIFSQQLKLKLNWWFKKKGWKLNVRAYVKQAWKIDFSRWGKSYEEKHENHSRLKTQISWPQWSRAKLCKTHDVEKNLKIIVKFKFFLIISRYQIQNFGLHWGSHQFWVHVRAHFHLPSRVEV